MKILQICPISLRVRSGGFAEYVRNISVRLAVQHDVTLLGYNPKGLFSRFETVDGVKVERLRYFSPGNAYYFSAELPLRLRKSTFDVVHAHGYQTFSMHVAALSKRRKFIVSPHFHEGSHSNFRDSLLKLFRPLGRRTLNAADNVVCVSDFEKSLEYM